MRDEDLDEPSLVVGIGSSAGGLEAIRRFLSGVTSPSPHAFVVIQHMSPRHESMMPELLSRSTDMPVVTVLGEQRLRPNTVYLVRSDRRPTVRADNVLSVAQEEVGPRHSISDFFEALSEAWGARSVVVVLSGSGSDGSAGLEFVHDAGGLVLVEGDTASFRGMPSAAAATNKSHASLDPASMPSIIDAFGRSGSLPSALDASVGEASGALRDIIDLMGRRYNVDFGSYKHEMVLRRVARRLSLEQHADFEEYLERLRDDRSESDVLYQNLLIGVTSFFRDPDAWGVFKERVARPLCEGADSPGRELRVWVAGCSLGQEVYSVAQVFFEVFDDLGVDPNLRIFATDVNDSSLAFASRGVYSRDEVSSISSRRLGEMFVELPDGTFRVQDRLRDRVLFSRQNLFEDAPFSRMDVVVCRNVLIYLGKSAHDRSTSALQFALCVGGHLFLGPSESLGDTADEYAPVERKWNIFTKTSDRRPLMLFPFRSPSANNKARGTAARTPALGVPSVASFESLLGKIAGDAVLIDPQGSVLHLFGEVSRLLRPAAGPMNTSLPSMCEGELRVVVGGAIKNALFSQERVVMASVSSGGEPIEVIVDPHTNEEDEVVDLLVRFAPSARVLTRPRVLGDDEVSQHVQELEQQLLASKLALQAAVQELELTNEELQSSNEELHANLEELQSTNEELHSVNEELYSVNAEYEDKLAEVRKIRAEQENLIRAADVGVIFVTSSRIVRFFSPLARRVFHLIDEDLGRDLAHINTRHEGADLIAQIDAILADDAEPTPQTLELDDGSFVLARMKSFQAHGEHERGVILTFSDVTELKTLRQRGLERKAQVQRILDHVPQGLWHTTLDGQNAYVNQYFVDFCGRSRESFKEYGWTDMIHPDDVARSVEVWDAANAAGEGYSSRFRMLHASLGYRWVESRGLPLVDGPDGLSGWYGSVTDIHDAHESAAKLVAFNEDLEELVAQRTREVELGEERLRLAGEYGTDGFWDWDLLTNEEYLSPGFKALFGYEDHEMESSPEAWQEIIHPEDRVKIEEAFRAHLEEGAPYELTVRYLHKNGSTVWVLCRGVAQKDDQGRWARMIGTHTDVTALKRAESELLTQHELDRSRDLVERVADSAPIMLWLANRRGEREYFNSTWAEFTGRAKELELGDGWLAGVSAESRARVKATIGRAVIAQEGYSVEYDLRRADGALAPVSERAVPFSDEEGRFAGYIGTVLDLSEQRTFVEEQRAQLERAASTAHLESLGVLAGGIAHDFNNILTAIIAPASIAKEDVARDSEVYELLTEIERAAHRAADLCRLLLDASGGTSMSPEVVDLNAVIADSVSLLPAARRKSARLEWRLDERTPHVEAEPTQLRRMIMNVVLNALDALRGESGDVRVETEVVDALERSPTHLAPGFEPPERGRFAVLTVSDTGEGIPRETMRRIFEPFFSTKPTGRGLGLSATRGALRAANGVLEVESVVGEGTSMRLWFPLSRAGGGDTSEGEARAVLDVSLGDATVLVVDDDTAIAGLVSRVLSRGGLDVHVANSATEALALCSGLESAPRLAFIDYTMPDMFGDALATSLRELFPGIGIVLLSGYSVEHTDAALDLGTFDAFIPKPFDSEQIVSVARAHLQGP